MKKEANNIQKRRKIKLQKKQNPETERRKEINEEINKPGKKEKKKDRKKERNPRKRNGK